MYLVQTHVKTHECFDEEDIAAVLGIKVVDNRYVYLMGTKMPFSYNPDKYTRQQLLRDYINTELHKYLPSGYSVHKSNRIA